jgi:hypothetical protein
VCRKLKEEVKDEEGNEAIVEKLFFGEANGFAG